jgi:hypothetical protein
MKKAWKSISFILFFCLFSLNSSNAITLSKHTEISLLTCGPGEELYSVFGHSAIRVFDPINKVDIVYNYGTFNFDTDYFYLKFGSGRLLYYLNTEEYLGFIKTYINENRSVYEQTLNLDSAAKQKLFELLDTNMVEKNRYYRYDFFYDNCTTRIRDILMKALGGKIDYTAYNPPLGMTFREIISVYIKHLQWTDLGVDLIFGLDSDKKMSKTDFMFLPEELMKAYDKAKINDSTRLVKKTKTIFTSSVKNETAEKYTSPFMIFSALFSLFLIITLFEIIKKRNLWLFDFLIFFITGLLGLVVASLTFGSAYIALHKNLVLLWAIPFHFLMAFFVARKNSKFVKFYFLLTFILMLLLLISWYFLPQPLKLSTIPMVLLLALRAFKLYYFKANEKSRRSNIYYR